MSYKNIIYIIIPVTIIMLNDHSSPYIESNTLYDYGMLA